MIIDHFEEVEKAITADPFVIVIDLCRIFTSPRTAYLKGEITFTDGSCMALFQHVQIAEVESIITDYRYHYMTNSKELIFRYDNAPHYSAINTYPHHKHIPSGVVSCRFPSLKDVLAEIDSIIIDSFFSHD